MHPIAEVCLLVHWHASIKMANASRAGAWLRPRPVAPQRPTLPIMPARLAAHPGRAMGAKAQMTHEQAIA